MAGNLLTNADVLRLLRSVDDPRTGRDVVDAELIRDVKITPDAISFTFVLEGQEPTTRGALAMAAKTALKAGGWQGIVQIIPGTRGPSETVPAPVGAAAAATNPAAPPKRGSGGLPIVGQSPARPRTGPGVQPPPGPPGRATQRVGAAPPSTASARKPVPGVKHIIAVASGKGGVGKSTVASNLAAALVKKGYKTGLLDNDVYGPSIPILFGITEKPGVSPEKKLLPIERDGIKLMSLGFLLDAGAPVIWRGPIVLQVTDQLFYDVAWGELDYLVLDLPPGTGDVQLTMSQKVPVTGAVIVTTPQDIALADAERGLEMFNKVNVPVLGIVENMSVFACPNCGHESHIFAQGGGRRKADQLKVPFLGEIPLDMAVREAGDQGRPIVLRDPKHAASKRFMEIAATITDKIEAEEASAGGLAGLAGRMLKIIQ